MLKKIMALWTEGYEFWFSYGFYHDFELQAF